jgi:nickel-dependent lactate racemase
MEYRIPYGDDFVTVEVPEERVISVIEPKKVDGVKDEDSEVERALENPIGSKRLEELARGRKDVMLLVDDATRPTPAYKIIPKVLDRLNKAGIKDENVTVMVALGTHRPMTREKIERKMGRKVVKRIKIMQHEWWRDEVLVDLGKTSSGIPIRVNRYVMEADLKVGIGNVAPHCRKGFSGGASIIQPGVCGPETSGYTHWIASKQGLERMLGKVDNPMRREIDEIAEKVGLDFIVNTVLNVRNEIVKVVTGDFREAYRECVNEALRVCTVEIPERADVMIADSHPADLDMWQADKGLRTALLATKNGGSMAFITPCWEGVSKTHPEVVKYGYKPFEEVRQLWKEGKIKDLLAASDISLTPIYKLKGCWLFSEGISKGDAAKLGFHHAETPQEAVDKAIGSQPPDAKIAIMRYSAEILPLIKKGLITLRKS